MAISSLITIITRDTRVLGVGALVSSAIITKVIYDDIVKRNHNSNSPRISQNPGCTTHHDYLIGRPVYDTYATNSPLDIHGYAALSRENMHGFW